VQTAYLILMPSILHSRARRDQTDVARRLLAESPVWQAIAGMGERRVRALCRCQMWQSDSMAVKTRSPHSRLCILSEVGDLCLMTNDKGLSYGLDVGDRVFPNYCLLAVFIYNTHAVLVLPHNCPNQ
jgi:hypothetical protein